jgi:hypothetical protein
VGGGHSANGKHSSRTQDGRGMPRAVLTDWLQRAAEGTSRSWDHSQSKEGLAWCLGCARARSSRSSRAAWQMVHRSRCQFPGSPPLRAAAYRGRVEVGAEGYWALPLAPMLDVGC